MQELTPLERSVLDAALAGPGRTLESLRHQLENCRVRGREFTGVGFYTDLTPDDSKRVHEIREADLRITDVWADIESLEHGAGFLLFVKDGLLQMLEGFTYDEPWPDEVKTFSVQYADAAARNLPPELTATD
jgi:hypothetical protein